MAFLRKIVSGLVKYDVTQYVGQSGTIFINAETGDILFSDGVTPGGIVLASSGIQSVLQKDIDTETLISSAARLIQTQRIMAQMVSRGQV